MPRESRTDKLLEDVQLLEGIEKNLPTYKFIAGTRPMSAAGVRKILQSRVDTARAVVAARLAYRTAVLASRAEESGSDPFVLDVRSMIAAMFSGSPDKLAGFGVTPRKPRTPLTAEQNLLAVQRRAATRLARHTMGSVQRRAIAGTLQGSLAVPLAGGETRVVPPPAPTGKPVVHAPDAPETAARSVEPSLTELAPRAPPAHDPRLDE